MKKKQILKAVAILGWIIVASGVVTSFINFKIAILLFITGSIFVSLRFVLLRIKKNTRIKPYVKEKLDDKIYHRQY